MSQYKDPVMKKIRILDGPWSDCVELRPAWFKETPKSKMMSPKSSQIILCKFLYSAVNLDEFGTSSHGTPRNHIKHSDSPWNATQSAQLSWLLVAIRGVDYESVPKILPGGPRITTWLLMDKILHHLGCWQSFTTGFIHPSWLFGISSSNCSSRMVGVAARRLKATPKKQGFDCLRKALKNAGYVPASTGRRSLD